MKISTSAETYADSLIKADENFEQILNDLNEIKEIISQSDEFNNVMENPSIQNEIKFEIIDEIFKNKINDKLVNFLKILVEKNRFNEFNQIIQAYSNKTDNINNIKRVEVISAIDLTEDQKSRINEKLHTKLQKNIVAKWTTNENIIGGLIIKYDDNVIDNSLKNKLEKLSKI